jgi:hypothetical protein
MIRLVKAWAKEVGKLALAQIAKAENLSANKRYNGVINVEFNLRCLGTLLNYLLNLKREFQT